MRIRRFWLALCAALYLTSLVSHGAPGPNDQDGVQDLAPIELFLSASPFDVFNEIVKNFSALNDLGRLRATCKSTLNLTNEISISKVIPQLGRIQKNFSDPNLNWALLGSPEYQLEAAYADFLLHPQFRRILWSLNHSEKPNLRLLGEAYGRLREAIVDKLIRLKFNIGNPTQDDILVKLRGFNKIKDYFEAEPTQGFQIFQPDEIGAKTMNFLAQEFLNNKLGSPLNTYFRKWLSSKNLKGDHLRDLLKAAREDLQFAEIAKSTIYRNPNIESAWLAEGYDWFNKLPDDLPYAKWSGLAKISESRNLLHDQVKDLLTDAIPNAGFEIETNEYYADRPRWKYSMMILGNLLCHPEAQKEDMKQLKSAAAQALVKGYYYGGPDVTISSSFDLSCLEEHQKEAIFDKIDQTFIQNSAKFRTLLTLVFSGGLPASRQDQARLVFEDVHWLRYHPEDDGRFRGAQPKAHWVEPILKTRLEQINFIQRNSYLEQVVKDADELVDLDYELAEKQLIESVNGRGHTQIGHGDIPAFQIKTEFPVQSTKELEALLTQVEQLARAGDKPLALAMIALKNPVNWHWKLLQEARNKIQNPNDATVLDEFLHLIQNQK